MTRLTSRWRTMPGVLDEYGGSLGAAIASHPLGGGLCDLVPAPAPAPMQLPRTAADLRPAAARMVLDVARRARRAWRRMRDEPDSGAVAGDYFHRRREEYIAAGPARLPFPVDMSAHEIEHAIWCIRKAPGMQDEVQGQLIAKLNALVAHVRAEKKAEP